MCIYCSAAAHRLITPQQLSLNATAAIVCIAVVFSSLQDQQGCTACVGFAATAAIEAAVNVYKQQSWTKLNLSEADFSFCK